MTLLDSVRDEFAEHNVPLHLLLGLLSLARRMDAHLPSSPAGPPAPLMAREAPPPEPDAAGADPLLHLLLGLISLRRTLLSELEPLRAAHEQARRDREAPGLGSPAPGAPASLHARDLLR